MDTQAWTNGCKRMKILLSLIGFLLGRNGLSGLFCDNGDSEVPR